MGNDERAAKMATRAAVRLAWVPAAVLTIGGGLGLLAAIGGLISHQLSAQRAALFVLVATLMFGGAAIQIALGRRAKRLADKGDA